ncbi:MAG: DUF3955 domain-containing protein [Candidatus Magasanikbacteria bacterium]|nr:DUF3955 domain-containing protein [Candidatus Magasanikbacteria bacterium]
MKRKYFVYMFLIIGGGCFVAFSFIGSYVASDGTLVEPFGLIPLGYLFLLIGIVLGVIFYVQNIYNKFKK